MDNETYLTPIGLRTLMLKMLQIVAGSYEGEPLVVKMPSKESFIAAVQVAMASGLRWSSGSRSATGSEWESYKENTVLWVHQEGYLTFGNNNGKSVDARYILYPPALSFEISSHEIKKMLESRTKVALRVPTRGNLDEFRKTIAGLNPLWKVFKHEVTPNELYADIVILSSNGEGEILLETVFEDSEPWRNYQGILYILEGVTVTINGEPLKPSSEGGSSPDIKLLMDTQDMRNLSDLTDDPKVLKWISGVLLHCIDSQK